MPLPELLAALADPPEVLARLRGVPGLRLVGGWLRQAYLIPRLGSPGSPTLRAGTDATDFDLTCELPLEQSVDAVSAVLGVPAFAVNERFATRRFVLAGKVCIDISQLTDNSITADIARRDFSVNTLSIALDRLSAGASESDLAGHPLALDDLASRTLRMVSEANLLDDPLRILRGYRLAATEGLAIEPETRAAFARLAGEVPSAAGERIHEELVRWFGAEDGGMLPPPQVHSLFAETVEQAATDGVLWLLFPPLAELRTCIQGEGLSVWAHTLDCLRKLDALRADLPPELAPYRAQLAAAWDAPVSKLASAGALTRIALLLHDIAKPATRVEGEGGKLSFHDHQNIGANLVSPLLRELKFSAQEIGYVLRLIREHLRLGYYSGHDPLPPRLAYRYLRRLGSATPVMVLHSVADCMATRGAWTTLALEQHLRSGAELLAYHFAAGAVASPPVLLDGEAIMRTLSLPPGKRVGQIKEALLEATAAGEVRDKAAALAFVRAEYEKLSG